MERHLENPKTPEEKIVHDANFFELLGAFGIAKAFTTGGFRRQAYEETIDIFESQYLNKIEFLTPQGKILAEEGRTVQLVNKCRKNWSNQMVKII